MTDPDDLPAMEAAFRRHCANRDNTNLGLLRYRDWQGFLITGQHSGTHWIKWMLSHAIAHQYDVPPPRYFNNASSNDLIGHPKHARMHPQLPRIASTHTIAPNALRWPLVRGLFPLPPYGVVVRDIRNVLISNYEKWRTEYDVPFSRYVAGDPTSKAYVCDVWWYIHFLNQWGDVAGRYPRATRTFHYEAFLRDRTASLKALGEQLGLTLSDEAWAAGAAAGDKEVMAQRQDPDVAEQAVRTGPDTVAFSEADDALLNRILDRNLKHDFGYRYFAEPRGFQGT